MIVLNVRNANEALGKGIELIKNAGEPIDSRAGMTLEVTCPVTTVYHKPWERVLINKLRDANPFFHLMEAMWILAGREDVKFLTEFNKRMGEYSDNGDVFNAPYGYRLRNGIGFAHDQLSSVIELLDSDPNSRQAVCQIWNDVDLQLPTKDKACNMSIVFRIRNGKLCMTVYNRSNDMIWGAYGANVVQFSMIQEYVAAHLGLPLGEYTQVSNSYHIYTEGAGGEVWDRIKDNYSSNSDIYDNLVRDAVYMMYGDMEAFEHDLKMFFNTYDQYGIEELGEVRCWQSQYFNELVMPMFCVYLIYKQQGPEKAITYSGNILADDWKLACEDWLVNRMGNK